MEDKFNREKELERRIKKIRGNLRDDMPPEILESCVNIINRLVKELNQIHLMSEEDYWEDGEKELEDDLPYKSNFKVFGEWVKQTELERAVSFINDLKKPDEKEMTPEEIYNDQIKYFGIQNFIWVQDEPTKFEFQSENFSVRYEKTGESDIICEGICLWQYKAKEVKFN